MPLPFLTATRDDAAPAGPAPEAYLPYEDRSRRRRPYRVGPWRVGGAALVLLLASYVLFSALIIAVAGSLPGAGVCLAVAVLLIVAAVRLVHVGLWLSPEGLRQVRLLSSTVLPWSEVAEVRTAQQPVRWLGLPRTVQGQALVVVRTQGEPVVTVVTDHGADFLGGPERFAGAVAAVERRVAEFQAG
ncbi:PH domain-containing protein [Streptomyces albireticuli]|uniref:PH domain-containing protein n=1 Tax=Streptomyces albireticuli TaxID=1940 RepID=A0A2A2DGX5_9ACTN|nr:PH domain-containing protein [Streptomyces albireticuli]MCD9145933.1 PH domain-containing protein [Streptomyces albireticuli]MCD9166125.1 PH domain-containing protein [Streptomyces albireticuli]MCD9196450.1 PH domain-containing protein [Streptomyces albireticuli]PAU50707.1 hypothetical protein CK936_01120 [Streptomyces albireticuli]